VAVLGFIFIKTNSQGHLLKYFAIASSFKQQRSENKTIQKPLDGSHYANRYMALFCW
jgi:hypothetical protein